MLCHVSLLAQVTEAHGVPGYEMRQLPLVLMSFGLRDTASCCFGSFSALPRGASLEGAC